MTYLEIKTYTDQLIQEHLKAPYSMPNITNHYHSEDDYRLNYNIEDTSFMLDICVDDHINEKSVMVWGAFDFGPFDISKQNILKAIQYIHDCIKRQFVVEYYSVNRLLHTSIILLDHDLDEKALNDWFVKDVSETDYSYYKTNKHPKGYTRIKKLVTQYGYNGEKRVFKLKDQTFKEIK